MKNVIVTLMIIGLYAQDKGNEILNEQVELWMNQYIGFEKNMGQIQNFEGEPVKDVLLRAKTPGLGIFITKKGVSYVLYSKEDYARIDIELLNSNIKEENIEYEEPLPGYSNYYLPVCPEGVLGVITYKKVRIKNVYEGIDWIWKYEDGKIHHEFEVKPFADISKIKMEVKYADVSLSPDGKKIIFSTPIGKIEDGEIIAYEYKTKNKVDISYKVKDKIIYFDIPNYSMKNTLIIDPPLALLWRTYYGGASEEYAYSVTADPNGNIFVTGPTWSTDFPLQNPGGGAYFQGTIGGSYDAFISKFETSVVGQKEFSYHKDVEENKIYTLTNSKSTVIIFEIKKPCKIGLNLYDLLGSLIEKRDLGYVEKGMYRIEIKNNEIKNKNIYFLKANMGKKSKTLKILNIQ